MCTKKKQMALQSTHTNRRHGSRRHLSNQNVSLGHLSYIIIILYRRQHIQNANLILQRRFQRIHMRESEKLAIVNPTLTRTHPTNPNRICLNIENSCPFPNDKGFPFLSFEKKRDIDSHPSLRSLHLESCRFLSTGAALNYL